MPRKRRIRTVLYGDQHFAKTELELMHTPALQRLYDLKQLGLTDRVFVDASHSRLHHVIGVVQQVENVMSALYRNLLREDIREVHFTYNGFLVKKTCRELAAEVYKRKPAVRLMGLLHDLTHAPFGHTLEDEIRLVAERHDAPGRQADAYYRLIIQYLGWSWRDKENSEWDLSRGRTEALLTPEQQLARYLDAPHLQLPPDPTESMGYLVSRGAELLRKSGSRRASLEEFFRELAFAMRALLHLDLVHTQEPDPKSIPAASYPFDELLAGILKDSGKNEEDEFRFVPQRDAFLLDVIGNTICADLLDYAKRDSFFAGMRLDYDAERIVENFTLVEWTLPTYY